MARLVHYLNKFVFCLNLSKKIDFVGGLILVNFGFGHLLPINSNIHLYGIKPKPENRISVWTAAKYFGQCYDNRKKPIIHFDGWKTF